VRTRLKPQERVRQILAAAALLIVEQGTFPIPLETLGQRLGVSKSLIYSYFPTQFDLANRLLAERLQAMSVGLQDAVALDCWMAAARACADIYFDETATHGTLTHILLSDLYVVPKLDPDLKLIYRQTMRQLALRIRAETQLNAKESVAALHMLAVIPEEAGNLVFLNRLDRDVGQEIARAMVVGGIEGLAAARPVAAPPRKIGRGRQASDARRPSVSG